MKRVIMIITIFFLSYSLSFTQTISYFAEESLGCIVLLEKKVDSIYVTHGTGFLLYDYTKKNSYYIITCEHVLRNSEIYISIPVDSTFVSKMKFNNQKSIYFMNEEWILIGNKLRAKYDLIYNKTFIADKNLDIGVLAIKLTNYAFEKDTIQIKIANIKGVPLSMVKMKKDIPLGTDVYFTGFPFSIGTESGFIFTGLFSDDIPNPLVRKGSVAWKSESNNEFLLDAFSYGGNSGSPVFTINDLQNKSYLIGMVKAHLPSEMSDNNGLARCIWIDRILELVEKYNKIN